MVEVSVVVPARDAGSTLAATLECLESQTLPRERYEIIVVDDGSADDTGAIAKRRVGVTVVSHKRARGAGEARNSGVSHAQAPLLAFTDADCLPTPEWLEAGLRAFRDGAHVVQGAVGPEPGVPRGPFDRWVTLAEDDGTYTTASLFVDATWFARVGGFAPPPLRDNGRLAVDKPGRRAPVGEDTWLGWRMRRRGARTAFAADAVVHHAVLPRGPAAYIREHTRRRHFPGFVAAIPEMRQTSFVWRGWFVNRRSPTVDAAALGLAAAIVTRRPAALVAAAPYVVLLADDTRRLGPKVAAVRSLADAVGLVALVSGNVRYRTLLL